MQLITAVEGRATGANEAAGCIASVRTQKAEGGECCCSARSLLGPPARGMVPPAFRWVFSPQLTLSRNDFTGVPRGCLLAGSKSSQADREG